MFFLTPQKTFLLLGVPLEEHEIVDIWHLPKFGTWLAGDRFEGSTDANARAEDDAERLCEFHMRLDAAGRWPPRENSLRNPFIGPTTVRCTVLIEDSWSGALG